MNSNTARNWKDATILVADDEFMIASDLEFVFSDLGARVVIASTLALALRAASDETLSMALLDIRLGTESSLPVAELLSQRAVPFLFFSGQLMPNEVRSRFPNAPSLMKPVDYSKLIEAAAGLLPE